MALTLPHYDIELHLSPLSGELRATVDLTLPFPGAAAGASETSADSEPGAASKASTTAGGLSFPETSELTFALHRSLCPEVVAGDDVAGYAWNDTSRPYPYATDGVALTVRFGHPPQAGETRRLTFAYRGRPGIANYWEVNRLTPEWVELGFYAPWFPLCLDEQFTYRVKVTADPGYEVFGVERAGDPDCGVILTSAQPTNDIVVLSAPDFLHEQRATGDDPVTVRFTASEDAAFAAQIADDGAEVLGFLGDWLGKRDAKQPEVVIAPRTTGGAYVRPGLVVMSRPESDPIADRQRYFRWVAHEFAHLWWYRAPATGWEDWLNEAFAEFCSLAAIRQSYGEETYAERLDIMRSRSEGLPPVMGLPRRHEQAYDVLYVKGCVILADLERTIGRERMTRFLREAYADGVTSTEALIQVLARVAGADKGLWLDSRLRS